MIFWRNKKNAADQEQDLRDEKLIHPDGEPEIEPSIENDNPEMDPEFQDHELEEAATEIIDELELTPVPKHNALEDVKEAYDFRDRTEEGGWFARLTRGLSKTSSRIGDGISDILTKKKLDEETLEKLEELLITADLGPRTAAKVVEDFSKDRFGKEITEEELKEALAGSIAKILVPVAKSLEIPKQDGKPYVVMVTGVNGVGKTTTIGKLAHFLHVRQHRKLMIAAADTFRAAAIEQLDVWAERAHTPLVKKDVGSDAAAVAFEAYEKAKEKGIEILLVDTAGRLHNKANLMAELEKIVRVLKKQDEDAPHETLLVLDATTGQNAHAQVETYKEIINISGLIVTKLDGSARGGVVVSLADQFGLPIYAVGVGEGIEDLQPFHPHEFARSLVGATD